MVLIYLAERIKSLFGHVFVVSRAGRRILIKNGRATELSEEELREQIMGMDITSVSMTRENVSPFKEPLEEV